MAPGSMSRSSIVLASFVVVSFFAAIAGAQPPSRGVTRSGCDDALGLAVESALVVELSDASGQARDAFAGGSVRSEIACDADGVTAIVVRAAARMEQRIEGGGPGVARRLAIALAELIEASVVPTEPVPPPVDPPAPASHEALVVRARASGGAWLGGEPLLALGTLDLGAELDPTSNVAIVLDGSGLLGAAAVEGARVDVRILGAGLSVRFGGDVDSFWLGAGPAMRGGAIFWSGTPTDAIGSVGHDVTGGWLGLGAVAAAFVRLADLPLRVGAEIEGGGVAYYSEALVFGARAQRIGGGWVELRLALDITFE